MNQQKFVNGTAGVTLAAKLLANGMSAKLAPGKGALFPMLTGGDYYLVWLTNAGNAESVYEAVKASGAVGDTLTIIQREAEGVKQDWDAGAKCECRFSAARLNALMPPNGSRTVDPGEPLTVQLPEGYTLSVVSKSTNPGTGIVTRKNSADQWSISPTSGKRTIDGYQGTQELLITCTAGSIDAVVGDAVLGLIPVVNVKNFGAVGDGRVVSDAVTSGRTGGGSLVVSSATANFTQADVGKCFGIHTTATGAAAYQIMSGTITSVQSATQFTGSVPNTTPAIASAGSLCIATNDTAALQAAYNFATTNGGGEVIHPKGIYGVTAALTIGANVTLKGQGKQQGRPFNYLDKGTTLVGLPPDYVASAMVILADRGGQIRDINVDAGNRFDNAVRIMLTNCKAYNASIGRGNVITHYVDAGSSTLSECCVYGAMKGTTIQTTGDALIGPNNYIFGAGNNLPNIAAPGVFDDCMIFGNHIYKGGWGINPSLVMGPNIKWSQFAPDASSGGVISGNVFDTAYGNHIEIEVFNTSSASAIKGLTIANNEFYQPQAIPNNTYSAIKITAGTTGAFIADIRALSITGNVGKGSQDGAVNYKSFIDWSIGTGGSRITGDVIGFNSIDACTTVYSGSAHVPAVTGTNVAISGAGTATVIA